jgi:hypothetical protein
MVKYMAAARYCSSPGDDAAANGETQRRKADIDHAEVKPVSPEVQPDGIPEAMKAEPRWVCWRYVRRRDKRGEWKWTKVPIDPKTGRNAKSNDRSTWGTYPEALAYYLEHRDRVDGVGFLLGGGYFGVDFDDAFDPASAKVQDWAAPHVAALDTYTEVSPSRTGVKAVGKGRKKGGKCTKAFTNGKVEVYGLGKYFTLTGLRLDSAPAAAEERQEALDRLYDTLFGEEDDTNEATVEGGAAETEEAETSSPPTGLDDEEVLRVACRARNGNKFRRLMDGDTSDHGGDDNRADLALVNLLAFYTRDKTQTDRLFRRSKLYRDKWGEVHYADGKTYGEGTIDKAFKGRTNFYKPGAKRSRDGSRSSNGSANGAHAPQPTPQDGEVQSNDAECPSGYQVILSYFRRVYEPVFRKGTAIYSGELGREVKQSEALSGAPYELISLLEHAWDAPMKNNRADRDRLPWFFNNWARSAWTDLIMPLAEEDDAAEIHDVSREDFRSKVKAALYTMVNLGQSYTGNDSSRTDVERRPLIDWCERFSKDGRWQDIRGHRIWTRKEHVDGAPPAGRLAVALSADLFSQLHRADLAKLGPNRFGRLCRLYGVGVDRPNTKVNGCRAVILTPEFVAELTARPED